MEAFGRHNGDAVTEVDEARRLIVEIGDIKDQTRADFRDGTWQWLIVWAVVCFGAAASAFTPYPDWYWIVGAPIGIGATMVITGRAEARVRIRRKTWPYLAISAGIGMANGAASYMFPPEVIVVAVWVVLGLGFAALTSLDRVPVAPGAFMLLAGGAMVAGVATRDPFGLYPVLAIAFASVLGGFAFSMWTKVPG